MAQTQLLAFLALAGRGARAVVEGNIVSVGGPRLLAQAKVEATAAIEKVSSTWASDGKTVLYVVAGEGLLGALAVEDQIRPESKVAVTDLHKAGIRGAQSS